MIRIFVVLLVLYGRSGEWGIVGFVEEFVAVCGGFWGWGEVELEEFLGMKEKGERHPAICFNFSRESVPFVFNFQEGVGILIILQN